MTHKMDMINFADAVMGNKQSPDIRAWPVFANLDRVHFAPTQQYERGNVNVWFEGKHQLEPGIGNQGPISYTLWGGFNRGGAWVFAPLVECIKDYVPTGMLFGENHVADNLLYFADSLDARIAKYQPKAGEQIALVVTTGDTRRQNAQPPGKPVGRTNVVLVKFEVGDYRFDTVTPVPEVPPVENPPPPPVVATPRPPAPTVVDLSEVVKVLGEIRELQRQLLEAWK